MGKVLSTDYLYDKLKQQLKEEASSLGRLTLASVKFGGDYSCGVYTSQQEKLAKELGINYRLIALDKKITLNKLLQEIKALNDDHLVNGILINRPFPKNFDESIIFSAVSVNKDIEGMNPYNRGRLFLDDFIFVPPTALSVLELLNATGTNLYGRRVTIVGFSDIIGKPLALLLGNRLATVSITHIGTYEAKDLEFYVKGADILISAVGIPQLIKGEWIKKGAIVIDVGVGKKNGKICGDVEFEKALKKASFVTPVPKGVGRLTTIFLFKNLVKAAKLK